MYGIFLARNLVFSRHKLALTLLCRTRYVLLYIKTPLLEFKICFFYLFSVKIMLKMHQKSFNAGRREGLRERDGRGEGGRELEVLPPCF